MVTVQHSNDGMITKGGGRGVGEDMNFLIIGER